MFILINWGGSPPPPSARPNWDRAAAVAMLALLLGLTLKDTAKPDDFYSVLMVVSALLAGALGIEVAKSKRRS